MNLSESYIDWLNNIFKKSELDCLKVIIYGSVAKYEKNPNDCDVMIITGFYPQTLGWRKLCDWRYNISANFKHVFKADLNILLVNIEEYFEDIPFLHRVNKRSQIIIKANDSI